MKYLLIVIIAVTIGMSATVAHAHQLPENFKGFEDPEYCGGCHKAIYDEWNSSMHARSYYAGDAVHSAVYDAFAKAMTAAGKPAPYFCASCHMPTADNMAKLSSGEAGPNPANPTNVRGVTCSFCHKADGLIEGERLYSYRITDGIKGRGGAGAPHEVVASDFASSYKLCMGCHGKMVNGKGGVICNAAQEGLSDCLKCHMAETDGAPATGSAGKTHAFHGMFGAHDPVTLGRGATVSLGSEMGRLLVSVKNPNPHFFPSTNPMRVAYVKVEVFDAKGEILFTNFKDDPSEDPQALLVKVFKSGDKVGVPTWEADGVAKDTRLRENEERLLTYKLPEGAARATAKLYYRFAAPMAVTKFGIPPDGTVEMAHLVSEGELAITK